METYVFNPSLIFFFFFFSFFEDKYFFKYSFWSITFFSILSFMSQMQRTTRNYVCSLGMCYTILSSSVFRAAYTRGHYIRYLNVAQKW